jgi:hypothetical protein
VLDRNYRISFTLSQARQSQRGSRGIALFIPDLGAKRCWVFSTKPRPLNPQEKPGAYCTGGWVVPRAGLDMCEKSRLYRDRSPDSPTCSQSETREYFVWFYLEFSPNPVATRSKAWVCSRSLAGVVVSNPAKVMDVRFLCVLCFQV